MTPRAGTGFRSKRMKGGESIMAAHWRRAGAVAVGLALTVGVVASMPQAPAYAGESSVSESNASDTIQLRAKLGIIYAQNGNRDAARAEFMKLIETPEGRPAALTNLGNLAFLEGRVEEALESYEQASALDEEDPGILLNAGLAFKMLGETEKADQTFAVAVEMAGGIEQASYLLGLHTAQDTGRGKASKVTADELRQMLVKADANVPKTDQKAEKSDKPNVTTRPGGSRAAEAVGEQTLYWKDR